MSDITAERPDHRCLFDVATEQQGYFTTDQAHACGFAWRSLHHHVQHGRFLHVRRGLYRLRDFPPSSNEEVMAAWLAAGREDAAISHESALDLLDLADVIPTSVQVTVPRSRRGLAPPSGTTIHTTVHPLSPDEVTMRGGIRITAAARTIVDVAEAGIGPEQVELAVASALERGITTANELRDTAQTRNLRVTHLIDRALSRAQRLHVPAPE